LSHKALDMGDIHQDPSMEDILASIKRVIAEDSKPAAAVPRARRATHADPAADQSAEPNDALEPSDEDVLELDDPVEDAGIMSTDAAAASRDRLAALQALRQRTEMPGDAGALEAVVRDMLRPMLRDWLDQNLPGIVEQLVTREIARITGRNL